jgi:hypothetical protein
LRSPPLLHGHPSACDAIHDNGTTERQKPNWADTYIDIDRRGGPDRRELEEIVNRKISVSAAETIKKHFTTLNSILVDHTSAHRASAL